MELEILGEVLHALIDAAAVHFTDARRGELHGQVDALTAPPAPIAPAAPPAPAPVPPAALTALVPAPVPANGPAGA
jgi:hypothetical protein